MCRCDYDRGVTVAGEIIRSFIEVYKNKAAILCTVTPNTTHKFNLSLLKVQKYCKHVYLEDTMLEYSLYSRIAPVIIHNMFMYIFTDILSCNLVYWQSRVIWQSHYSCRFINQLKIENPQVKCMCLQCLSKCTQLLSTTVRVRLLEAYWLIIKAQTVAHRWYEVWGSWRTRPLKVRLQVEGFRNQEATSSEI